MLDCICITDRLGDDVEEEVIVYTAYNITILHICSASEEGEKKGKVQQSLLHTGKKFG